MQIRTVATKIKVFLNRKKKIISMLGYGRFLNDVSEEVVTRSR